MSFFLEEKRAPIKWEGPVAVTNGIICGWIIGIVFWFWDAACDFVLYSLCDMVHMTIVCAGLSLILWVAFEPSVRLLYYMFCRWITNFVVKIEPPMTEEEYAKMVMENSAAIPIISTPVDHVMKVADKMTRCLYCHTPGTGHHCGSCGAAL